MRLKLKMHQSHNKDKLYYLRNNTWMRVKKKKKHSAKVLMEGIFWSTPSRVPTAHTEWLLHEGFQYHLCSTGTHTGLQSGCLIVVAHAVQLYS